MRHLSEVVDFEVLLARDEDIAAREGGAALLVRDRTLASRLPGATAYARLRGWVGLRRAAELDLPGERARTVVVLIAWVLTITGVITGVGTATALLAYDGRAPINVLAWLLYTAAIPFALAVVLVLGLVLPSRWLPRAGAAQSLLGTVLEPLLRRFSSGKGWARDLFGRTGRDAAGLQRWLLVALTQGFSLGFLLAVLATLLVKVTISDLTFSWSTTLKLNDTQVTAIARGVAGPWAAILPDAAPEAEAVARSNYRRFVERFRDTDQRSPVDVAIGATWWKWSALAVVVYGIVPRILLLLLALWRWRLALARWPHLDRPDVQALLTRFDDAGGAFSARGGPRLEPGDLPAGRRPDEDGDSAEAPSRPRPPAVAAPLEAVGLAVAWGSAAADPAAAARALGSTPAVVLGAGADLDMTAEREALSAAAERGGPVTVLMPLSEPPIEDALGFLRELRSIAPRVIVVSLELDDRGWHAAPTDDAWAKALARVKGVEVHGA